MAKKRTSFVDAAHFALSPSFFENTLDKPTFCAIIYLKIEKDGDGESNALAKKSEPGTV